MANEQHLHDNGQGNGQGKLIRRDAKATVLAPRRQSIDMPFSEPMDETGGGLAEYWQVLRRRKGSLFLMIGLGLLIALVFTLPQTPIYEARGLVEIQTLNENFLNMRNVSPTADDGGSTAPGYDVQIQTQATILHSQSLLDRVATKLDLENRMYPAQGNGRSSSWRKGFGIFGSPQAPTREKLLEQLAGNLKISINANTRLVEIRYDSPDPQLASDFVNTLTSEYVKMNVESHLKTNQQTGEWLTQQMEDVKAKLEKSGEALQAYAQASGLMFTSEKDNVAEEKLRQFQEEVSKAQEERVISQSKYELVSKAAPESLPQVLDDPTLKDYQVKLTDLRRQLAEISSTLTPAHPAVKKVQAQVTTLEQALDQERANVIQRIWNEYESAKRREHLLAANYTTQASLVSEQAGKVAHYNILKNEVDSDRQLYNSMLQNVQQASLSSALSSSNVRVVDPAIPPSHPYKPTLALNAALGLLGGAFFGLAYVVVQERADRSIRGPGDTTIYLDVPELGAIPAAAAEGDRIFSYYQSGKSLESKTSLLGQPLQVELVTSSKRPSILADSFRAALTSILYSGENGDRPRVIVITSANPGEGKTSVASNLALALAEISQPVFKQSVLLIDGDMRKPRLHEIFGVPNRWGFSDLLEGKTPPAGCEEMVFKTGYRNLFLLPSGSPSNNTAALLHSPRALEFLNRMREEFHTIIIDTPPMLHMPDARIIGRFADGVILVVRSAQTIRESALAVKQRLSEDGTRILGTILNQWDPRETNQYTYGYTNKH
jgi:capsular exopolysaccharide synthesis family protein